MSTPCQQEATIAEIATSMKYVSGTLSDMKHTQDKLVILLEKVAAQDARLDHLEEHVERFDQHFNEAFQRVRDIELNQAAYGPEARLQFNNLFEEVSRKMDDINTRIERVNRFVRMLTSKPAYYIYAVIIGLVFMGAISDYEFHREWFKSIIMFFK